MSHTQLRTRHRRAFVTGASSGLGRAFCEMLLADGVQVWGTSRDALRLAGLQGRSGFHPVIMDLSVADSATDAFERAVALEGEAFDLVVLNAGYGVFAPFEQIDFALWRAQVGAMLIETAALAHAALKRMKTLDTPASLVLVSSVGVEFPLPFMSGYNMSKAALSALAETLMDEARGSRRSVIDFRPGDYQTMFNRSMDTGTRVRGERMDAVWARLEANLQAAPGPGLAAMDLRRALLRGRSGTVRSGSFFQIRMARLFAALAPAGLQRRVRAWYFGNLI